MRKLINSALLLITAIVLSVVLFPVGIGYTLFLCLYRLNLHKFVTYLTKIWYICAEAIDLIGNVVCRDLFRIVLIKKAGYRFGVRKETISSVLGKNERSGTLKRPGKILVTILDLIEKDHCKKSIKEF